MPDHFVSASCAGEVCRVCGAPATHKLGEEIPNDDPVHDPAVTKLVSSGKRAGLTAPPDDRLTTHLPGARHNLTAYVCCVHYCLVAGDAAPCAPRAKDDAEFERRLARNVYEKMKIVDQVVKENTP